MSINRLLTQDLDWQATTDGVDEYGNDTIVDAGAATPVRGLIQQASTVEYLNDRDTTVTQWKAFLPAGTAVTSLDTLTFQGQTFQVTGAPYPVFNPRSRQVSHLEMNLTEVT